MSRAASIRIFLVDGTPAGIWVVEKSGWTGVALAWSRARHADGRSRAELDRAGVYLLVGPADDSGRESVYIGEAEALRNRLDQHHRTTDFWTRVVAFTTKDRSLNKAHCKYLESKLVEQGVRVDRADFGNRNVPQRPALVEAEIADVEAFFDEMLVLFPVLGIRLFEEIDSGVRAAHVLHARGPEGAEASGEETAEGFVVFKGSHARRTTVGSMQAWLGLRAELITNGVLEDNGESLVFTRDWLFSSPSAASTVVLGRNSNGRIEWRDETGSTLKELQSRAVTQ